MERVSLETTYDKYLAYLESQRWAELRNEALKRDKYHCSICGCPESLEVHHLKYPDTLGTEPLSDLMTLCHDCHVKLEAYKKGHKKSMKMYEWKPPKESTWDFWLKFESVEAYKAIEKDICDFLNEFAFSDCSNSEIHIYFAKEGAVRDSYRKYSHYQIEEFEKFIHDNFDFCEPKLVKTEE